MHSKCKELLCSFPGVTSGGARGGKGEDEDGGVYYTLYNAEQNGYIVKEHRIMLYLNICKEHFAEDNIDHLVICSYHLYILVIQSIVFFLQCRVADQSRYALAFL